MMQIDVQNTEEQDLGRREEMSLVNTLDDRRYVRTRHHWQMEGGRVQSDTGKQGPC